MSKESTQRIEEHAGDWLARRDSHNWSEAEQAAFEDWLDESTHHRVAYLRLENVWEAAGRLKALGAGFRSEHPPPPGQWNLSPVFTQRAEAIGLNRRNSRLRVRALAASLVVGIAISAAWYLWPPGNSYETPVGGVASVPMSDGSKVTLNTDSKIELAINDKERRVELTQGEAFFDVAKDTKRPFIVVAGHQRVVALGTKFSVRRGAGAEDIQVVVTEGAVRVESSDAPLRILTAGTVAHANRDGLMVQQKKLPEAEEQLSWRSGVLIFRDITLREAAAEFNRYNERKIVIEDADTGALQVAGNFRSTNVDAFVRLLEQGYPVETNVRDQQIVVTAR